MVAYWKQKRKECAKYLAKTWSLPLKKSERWSLTREVLKQHLTEKQKVHLQSSPYGRWSLMGGGRLREVVAHEKRSGC